MRKVYHWYNYVLSALISLLGFGMMTGCTGDEYGPDTTEVVYGPPIVISSVTIVNNMSSTTLYRFRVVFSNSKGETIFDQEYGDFLPYDYISVKIPTGAVTYYLATYDEKWYFSPDYQVSVTSLSLNDSSTWTSNN